MDSQDKKETSQVFPPASPKQQPKMMRVFKSSMGTLFYVLKNGKAAHFVGGKYLTDMEEEIKELESEIRNGHPHIYIDDKEKEIDVHADPLKGIKDLAVKEYLAEQARLSAEALNKGNMGETEQGKLNVANSTSVAAGASGSSSNAGAVGVNTGAGKAVGATLATLKR
jgi:hypothetical protein